MGIDRGKGHPGYALVVLVGGGHGWI
jgi:hypothetical protein